MYQIYKEKDNIYLNIPINQNPTQGNLASIATYNESLTIPLLEDCSKYYCSIIRFTIPLSDLPILIMPILNNQTNPNLTPLIFGIRNGGVNYPVNVIYVSAQLNQIAPTPGSPPIYFNNTQLTSFYYWVYSFTQVINMFNTAINQAMIDAGLGVTPSPFFTFDPVTQLISLNISNSFIVSGAELYMNFQSANFLSSFNVNFHGLDQPQGRDISFILNPLPPNSPLGGPYVYTEDYNSIELWFSLSKILITSNSLPIQQEVSPTQNIIGLATGVSNYIPIITDFVPQLDFSNQSRSIAYYVPQGQYRLVDMISEIPLTKLNFNILWQDKNGNIFPLYIDIFQQAELKIAFIRKNLYKNTSNLLTRV
jgi:hypothetical protein